MWLLNEKQDEIVNLETGIYLQIDNATGGQIGNTIYLGSIHNGQYSHHVNLYNDGCLPGENKKSCKEVLLYLYTRPRLLMTENKSIKEIIEGMKPAEVDACSILPA